MATVDETNGNKNTQLELLTNELASENERHNAVLSDIHLRMLEATSANVRSVIDQKGGAVVSHGNDTGDRIADAGDTEQVDASFEEPDVLDLSNALKDLESRVGLSGEEYKEKYNLQDVVVNFAAFKNRLDDAPVEKRVRIVEAHQRKENLVLFCKNDSGEFGLMNPRKINRELVNREFNARGARHNVRDPEQSQVNILRARGMVHATKKDALHVTPLDSDNCEGVYWFNLAPKENMTPEELDQAPLTADFDRKYGRTVADGFYARYHNSGQGGLVVLWV